MGANLNVRNFLFFTIDQELQECFSAHEHMVSAKGIAGRETGRFQRFGFVEMSSPDEAQAAITALYGADLRGRFLAMNGAQAQELRRSFSGRPKNVD